MHAVVDGSRESEQGLERILHTAEQARHGIVILSKSDLPQKTKQVKSSLPVLHLSSLSGEGLELLEKQIHELFPLPAVPAGEILTNARQADAVRRAVESMEASLQALEQGRTPDIILTETEAVMQALGELTGSSIRDDITDRIFSRFCVGK